MESMKHSRMFVIFFAILLQAWKSQSTVNKIIILLIKFFFYHLHTVWFLELKGFNPNLNNPKQVAC